VGCPRFAGKGALCLFFYLLNVTLLFWGLFIFVCCTRLLAKKEQKITLLGCVCLG